MTHILIVEDDVSLCDGIALSLTSSETTIQKSYNISTARSVLLQDTVQLIILDINLPDGNGLDFLREIKSSALLDTVKIILLTANDMESDIVIGLESGADDYITKPFSLAVLRARVNTQLRSLTHRSIYIQDYFKFNFENMVYQVKNKQIELSKTEQKLLKLLIDNRGNTLTRATLIDRIWTDGLEYVDENALSVSITRLRNKLENKDCIKTIYGIGYSWVI